MTEKEMQITARNLNFLDFPTFSPVRKEMDVHSPLLGASAAAVESRREFLAPAPAALANAATPSSNCKLCTRTRLHIEY